MASPLPVLHCAAATAFAPLFASLLREAACAASFFLLLHYFMTIFYYFIFTQKSALKSVEKQ